MHDENIKTKIDLHRKGQDKPFLSVEDYNTLKELLKIDPSAIYDTPIESIKFDGTDYKVLDIKTEIVPQPVNNMEERGVEAMLLGPYLPYNFRVHIFVEPE